MYAFEKIEEVDHKTDFFIYFGLTSSKYQSKYLKSRVNIPKFWHLLDVEVRKRWTRVFEIKSPFKFLSS